MLFLIIMTLSYLTVPVNCCAGAPWEFGKIIDIPNGVWIPELCCNWNLLSHTRMHLNLPNLLLSGYRWLLPRE